MNETQDAAVRTFTCPQCGATQRFDPATRTLSCPFCGTNLDLDPAPGAPVDSVPPQDRAILPFAVARDDALARLRTWLGAGFWSPNDLAARAAAGVAIGVYVPHYGFIMEVHANWTGAYAQTHHRTEVYTERDYEGRQVTRSREVPYTVWYPESGRYDGTHSTMVCASRGLTQREADAVAPFDLNATERDVAGYLAGFVSELPAVAADAAWRSTGKGRIEAEVQADCAAMTDELRTYHWTMERFGQTLIWLPVWICGYRYGGTYRRVVMNGRTGKIAGERPVSARKVGVAILIVMIAMLLIVVAIHNRSA